MYSASTLYLDHTNQLNNPMPAWSGSRANFERAHQKFSSTPPVNPQKIWEVVSIMLNELI